MASTGPDPDRRVGLKAYEPLRVTIHLRGVDGLSYREIAVVTGVPGGRSVIGFATKRIDQNRIDQSRVRHRTLRGASGWC